MTATVLGLIKRSGNERFGWDSYRRFISLFGTIVLNISDEQFHLAMERLKEDRKIKEDTELTVQDFKDLVNIFKQIIIDNTGKPIPKTLTSSFSWR